MHFICLSVWGWNNIDSFISIPNILFNSFIISTINYGSLSDTILSSNSCNFQILTLNNHTNSSADIPSIVAIKYIILDNLSQIIRITSFSATNNNFVMKSTIRCIHGFSRISLNFNFSASPSILFFIL